MRLFIAEKPSLGRAIADVLPTPHERRKSSIVCGKSDVVAWCAGHILEPAPPEAYGAEYKDWRIEHLPISPSTWQLETKASDLLRTIAALLKRATRVVHAGDPDREGQLLVDEVLEHLGYRGPVDRLLVRDLRPEGVRAALATLEPNERYRSLSRAALARQRADWLYGMNMTRLYTVLGRNGGHDGVLSVGRVQTPLLGLIVRRDQEIAAFKPKPYYQLRAPVRVAGGEFRATWVPSNAYEAELDEDGRLLSRSLAEAICERTSNQPGTVSRVTSEKKVEPPPLPYALADLQVDAGQSLALSAAATLEACQSLYEHHRLVTYPRSDCTYLPEGHHAEARAVFDAIAMQAANLTDRARTCDPTVRSRAFDDGKVTAHHAIIPTPNEGAPVTLNDKERGVYELIARRYLMQFLPAFEYRDVRIELEVLGERFSARGRERLREGWRVLEAQHRADTDDPADESEREEPAAVALPAVHHGETVETGAIDIVERKTAPPKAFTDASLIRAMCNVARYVSDPKAKQILRETDGIGTPATRAAIIETLFERRFVERRGKMVRATATGHSFICALPAIASQPDLTAIWEAAMRRILDGEQSLEAFLDRVDAQLRALIQQGKALGALNIAAALPQARPAGSRRRSEAPAFRTEGDHPEGDSKRRQRSIGLPRRRRSKVLGR